MPRPMLLSLDVTCNALFLLCRCRSVYFVTKPLIQWSEQDTRSVRVGISQHTEAACNNVIDRTMVVQLPYPDRFFHQKVYEIMSWVRVRVLCLNTRGRLWRLGQRPVRQHTQDNKKSAPPRPKNAANDYEDCMIWE